MLEKHHPINKDAFELCSENDNMEQRKFEIDQILY